MTKGHASVAPCSDNSSQYLSIQQWIGKSLAVVHWAQEENIPSVTAAVSPRPAAAGVYLRFLFRFAFAFRSITDADGRTFPPVSPFFPILSLLSHSLSLSLSLSLSPFNWRRQKVEYDCGADAAAADRPRGGRGGVIPTTAAA